VSLAEAAVLFHSASTSPYTTPQPQFYHPLWSCERNYRIHWKFSLRTARAETAETENSLVEAYRCASTILTGKYR